MIVAVVGVGNVGSGLLYFLALNAQVDQVLVISRNRRKAQAARMDVASATPAGAAKLQPSAHRLMSAADVVILTAGASPEAIPDREEMHRRNRAITSDILAKSKWASTAILIVLATPVDDIAPLARRATGLPPSQVIGFGGDLDRNRVASILLSRGLLPEHIRIVGEHGRKVIPAYPEETDYEQVASQARNYLSTIIELAGPPRNLATSVLLDELVRSIATDSRRTHHVCGYHPEFGVFLTWPFKVGRQGLSDPEIVRLGPQAQRDLHQLVEERRHKEERLASIGPCSE